MLPIGIHLNRRQYPTSKTGEKHPFSLSAGSVLHSLQVLNRSGEVHPPWVGPSMLLVCTSSINLLQKHPHGHAQGDVWPGTWVPVAPPG